MKKNEQFRRMLPWIFLIGVYVLLLVVFYLYGSHHLYGDLSNDLFQADFLNKEGKFISENLFYTSELQMFNVVNGYQLGLMIFPNNWHLARMVAIALLLAGMAAAFIYQGRAAGLKEAPVWGAAVIMMPMSYSYMFLVTYGLAYVCYMIFAFTQVGLILHLAKGWKEHKLHWWIRLILLLVVAFCGGLQGLRMMMLSAAPVGLTMGVMFLIRAVKSGSIRELLRSRETGLLLLAVVNGAAVMVGYLINDKILSKIYTYQNFGMTMFKSFSPAEFLKHLDYLGQMLGTAGPVKITALNGVRQIGNQPQGAMSGAGLLTVAAAALMMFLLACLIILAVKGEKMGLDLPQRTLAMLGLVSVVLGLFINTVTGTTESFTSSACYYMGGVMLMMGTGFFLFEKMHFGSPVIRSCAMALLACVFLAIGAGTLYSSDLPKQETAFEKAGKWLVENDLHEGYSPFWNAHILMECSNGQVEMWTVPYLNQPELLTAWGQPKDHITRKPAGRTFFFYVGDLSTDEPAQLQRWMKREPDWACVEDGLIYIIYAGENTEALYTPWFASLEEEREAALRAQ